MPEKAAYSTLRPQIDRAGVTVYEHTGTAKFVDAHTIACGRSVSFRAKKAVICAGGVSRKLNVPGWELTSSPYDRPIIDGRTGGFCKLVADPTSFQILGCDVVGERAVEVAQMAAIAMTAGMQIPDLARIPLSFPTYANVVGRAALRAVRELGATPS